MNGTVAKNAARGAVDEIVLSDEESSRNRWSAKFEAAAVRVVDVAPGGGMRVSNVIFAQDIHSAAMLPAPRTTRRSLMLQGTFADFT